MRPPVLASILRRSGRRLPAGIRQRVGRVLARGAGEVRTLAAKGTSDEPNALLQWASAAQSANDVTTAITAYQQFLKVAPDNANAPAVRQTLAQLQASLGQQQG